MQTPKHPASNERLRGAITKAGSDLDDVALHLGVDRKSVERWIAGRIPRPRHRTALAALLREDEKYLWPNELGDERVMRASREELVSFYPSRAEVPNEAWRSLIKSATRNIDILVYAALFLHEQNPDLNDLINERAAAGCAIRVALGDPDCPAVQLRGREETFGDGIDSRCRLAIRHYQPVSSIPNITIRTHQTTLYNSIYRFDDDMIVNTHVYGSVAYIAPTMHIRRLPNGALFDAYAHSFDTVWALSTKAYQEAQPA